ncbi:MAG: DMT family transporter [Lentisphaeria bacterium]|nr:DMT family transporter [Lentisphaeria bacterium]
MRKQKFYSVVAMLIATVLWGFAFSAQACGMRHVGAMLFVALRSIVGVAALCVTVMCFDLVRYKRLTFWGNIQSVQEKKFLLAGGVFCGVIICGASFFQQLGLRYVSAGKTGFLTALYIIMVPLLGIFFKRKTPVFMWAAVLAAMLGTYLLCGGTGVIGKGEIFVIICALLFALHIMVIDHYAPHCDCVRLSCVQFATATVVAAMVSLILREPWQWQEITRSLAYWVYCGIGSSAIAFTLQMVSQKYLHPVAAALLMSLESVFGVLGGWLFLQEVLSLRELIGCGVILAAVIIAQMPGGKKQKIPR